MTRVKCRRRDCVLWEEGVCGRDLITIDEDEGCINFEESADLLDDDDDLDWDSADEEEQVDFIDDEEEEWEDESDKGETETPRDTLRDDWGI